MRSTRKLKFSWSAIFTCLGMVGLLAIITPIETKIKVAGFMFIMLTLYAEFMTETTVERSDWLFGVWMLVFTAYSFLIKHIVLPNYLFWVLYSLAVLSVFVFYLYWKKTSLS